MDMTEFQSNLDRFGSDLSSWPDSAREAAERFVQDSRQAADVLADAKFVDAMLISALPVPEPIGLRALIMSQIDTASDWLSWLLNAKWKPLALATVPLVLGFFIGMAPTDSLSDLEDDVAFQPLTDPVDLSELSDE